MVCAGVALSAGGCSRGQEAEIPTGCQAGERSVHQALARAPGEVTVQGTRLSDCLVARSNAVEVQSIGAVYLGVTSDLAEQARARPAGPAATRLGYLIGAVRRGAARTQGIHDELRRRLEQELVVVDTRSAAFREGERAGRTSG